ncbi:GspE/PulE family protein [Candidatus Epulonipiscium viviparus]
MNEFYKSNSQIVDLVDTEKDEVGEDLFTLDSNGELETDTTIKSVIQSVIDKAIVENASDIHMEVMRENVLIRFRIDGRLQDIKNLSRGISKELVNAVKTFSNMDITNNKETQDGYLSYQNYDIRVNTLPSINGEKIVMRLRKNEDAVISLMDVGFSKEDLKYVNSLLKIKSGMVIVTGPTGSGKSTTLASFLQELNSEYVNIVSIEDPVEIIIEGITQVNINDRGGFGFEQALKGILRQDIDVLMIGELRDKSTAEIATRAALTGHTILSTLHTENSTGAIYRMTDMDISPVMIKETVKGVIAQRLLRKLCLHCKKMEGKYFVAVGCEECGYTGYKGRTAIFEILIPKVHLANMDYTQGNLYMFAKENGLVTLGEKAMMLVERGLTSIEEAKNILGNFEEGI